MRSFKFTDFDNPVYFKNSTTLEVKSLVNKIKHGAADSPFINFDISDLILSHLPYLRKNFEEQEVKTIVSEAVFYFKKGKKEEIYQDLLEKINNSK